MKKLLKKFALVLCILSLVLTVILTAFNSVFIYSILRSPNTVSSLQSFIMGTSKAVILTGTNNLEIEVTDSVVTDAEGNLVTKVDDIVDLKTTTLVKIEPEGESVVETTTDNPDLATIVDENDAIPASVDMSNKLSDTLKEYIYTGQVDTAKFKAVDAKGNVGMQETAAFSMGKLNNYLSGFSVVYQNDVSVIREIEPVICTLNGKNSVNANSYSFVVQVTYVNSRNELMVITTDIDAYQDLNGIYIPDRHRLETLFLSIITNNMEIKTIDKINSYGNESTGSFYTQIKYEDKTKTFLFDILDRAVLVSSN